MGTNRNYRIRTNVNEDKILNVNLNQDYDFLEILSLKINQKNLYKLHTSNYGVVVGRVVANGGVGVPNAKISVFIEKSKYVTENTIVSNLYPYNNTSTLNNEKIRYNLLTEEKLSNCHQNIGTFPSKRTVLDDKNVLETFDNYYKYTCTTNNSGDYMLFGIPTGNQILHVDIDLSDIGFLSQSPRDFVYKGYNIDLFENPNQFRKSTDLNSLSQIFSQDSNVYVQPFWGDETYSDSIAITRNDINISYKIEPTCVFMGSIVTDGMSTGISKRCIPSKKMGKMDELTTSSGTIEMIRKTIDGDVEVFAVKGTELIDSNGTWCYQIPMNLDYITTDEYGNIVPTNDMSIGIPTRSRVRFRIGLNGGNTMNYEVSKILVPHNPQISEDIDYEFGKKAKDDEFGTKSFRDLMWNNVYTVKSYIPRIQYLNTDLLETFTGIKNTNINNGNNPIPYNNIRIKMPFLYTVVCALVKAFVFIVGSVNVIVKNINLIINKLNDIPFVNITNLSYVYIPSGLCPQLDGWYFIPGGVKDDATWKYTITKIKNKVGEDKQSIDYKNGDTIDGDVFYGKYTDIETLKSEVFKGDKKVGYYSLIPIGGIFELEKDSETNGGASYKKGIYKLTYFDGHVIEGDEYKYTYTIENTGSNEITAIDNIHLSSDTNYLIQCMETSLAEEYEVIKFDFYNDWINGLLYTPKWFKRVRNKKSYLFGLFSVNGKTEGCVNSLVNVQRRLTQQCAMGYEKNDGGKYYTKITTDIGCKEDSNKQRCHKKPGRRYRNIFTKESGILNRNLNDYDSFGNYYYYYRPCDSDGNTLVKLFATDIVLLGSLDDCSSIPSVLKELQSTSFQLPPALAQTNMEDTGYMYGENGGSLDRKDGGKDNFGTYETIEGDKIEQPDEIPMTEVSGIDWGYAGPEQGENNPGNLYYPGGHFLGMSCGIAETNIKSCVNLSRVCEHGVSLSQREEVDTNEGNEDYSKFYLTPTGLISKDEINDSTFRTIFATLNFNNLKTKRDKNGYLKYDMEYINPTNFNGELEEKVYTSNYFADGVSKNIYTGMDTSQVDLHTVAKIKNEDLSFSNEIIIIGKEGSFQNYLYNGNNRDTIINISDGNYEGKIISGNKASSIYKLKLISKNINIKDYSVEDFLEKIETKRKNIPYTKYTNDNDDKSVICVDIYNITTNFKGIFTYNIIIEFYACINGFNAINDETKMIFKKMWGDDIFGTIYFMTNNGKQEYLKDDDNNTLYSIKGTHEIASNVVDDGSIKLSYSDTYLTDIAKNSIRRALESPSDDYYRFRFGLNKTNISLVDNNEETLISNRYLDTSSSQKFLPMYENSYYFYFGLKNGDTALDTLRRRYYGICPNTYLPDILPSFDTFIKDDYEGKHNVITIQTKNIALPLSFDVFLTKKDTASLSDDNDVKTIDALEGVKIRKYVRGYYMYSYYGHDLILSNGAGGTMKKVYIINNTYENSDTTDYKEIPATESGERLPYEINFNKENGKTYYKCTGVYVDNGANPSNMIYTYPDSKSDYDIIREGGNNYYINYKNDNGNPKEWNNSEITIQNLPKGEHIIKIKGKNNENLECKINVDYHFIVNVTINGITDDIIEKYFNGYDSEIIKEGDKVVGISFNSGESIIDNIKEIFNDIIKDNKEINIIGIEENIINNTKVITE